jgi:hypothetical protein
LGYCKVIDVYLVIYQNGKMDTDTRGFFWLFFLEVGIDTSTSIAVSNLWARPKRFCY